VKFRIDYIKRTTIEIEAEGMEDAAAKALFASRNHAGTPYVQVVQILAPGIESQLLDDQPREPSPPVGGGAPPSPPGQAPAGDQMTLRREAA
jgi:hypothetical protein